MDNLENFSPLFKIAITANKISNTLTKSLKTYDIASEQRAILDIAKKRGDITQNQISSILGKDKTTVSRSLDAIEKKGYIKRVSDKDDKRVKLVQLTKRGEEVLDNSKEFMEEFRANSLDGLDEKDKQLLSSFLERIYTNIEKNYDAE